MKKVLAIMIILLMTLNMSIMGATQIGVNYQNTDIDGHWGYDVMSKWINNGYISGYPDGTFRPDGKITIAEFLTIVNRVFGFYETSEENYNDVDSKDWFSDQTFIAKKNGYMEWYERDNLIPNDKISRQEVSAILTYINNIKKSNDLTSIQGYNDKVTIPKWSRGYIDAVVSKGYMNGYEDNTLRPNGEITRAEAVSMLDRVIGELINKEGTYGPVNETRIIESNLTITTKDVVLQNTTIKGDLILAAGIKEGEVELKNVTVEGQTIVNGGGENSITFTNCNIEEIFVLKVNGKIRILSKDSTFGKAFLKSGGKLEGKYKDARVEVLGKGEKIEFEGDFDEIIVGSPALIDVTDDTIIDVLEISKQAKDTQIDVDSRSELKEIIFKEAAQVKGKGKIVKAVIEANGVTVEQRVYRKIVSKGIDGSGVKVRTRSSSSSNTPPADTTAPTPGGSGTLTTSAINTTSITLNWTKGTDNKITQTAIQYQVYYSLSDNISTVDEMNANGTSAGVYTDINTLEVTELTEGTTYYFNVIIKDEAENESAYTTVSETTAIPPDETAPTVNTYIPVDNASNESIDSNLVLTFDEDVVKGTGNIIIKKASNDEIVETISITDSDVSISNAEVTISPTSDFEYNTEYYVNIDEGAFKDVSDNNYAGINDKTTWNFTTKGAPVINPTNVSAADSDSTGGAVDGRDICVSWTLSEDPLVTSQEIYLVTSGTALNTDTMTAFLTVDANSDMYAGNAGQILDSEGNLLLTGDYDVYVVAVKETQKITSDKATFTISSEGVEDGSTSNPYLIDCIEDLARIGHGIDGDTDYIDDDEWGLNKNYKLTTDIDFTLDSSYGDPVAQIGDFNGNGNITGIKDELTSGRGWLPIGDDSNKFTGVFDGLNKTINKLYSYRITINDSNIGLFGYIDNGNLKNINLTNITITGNGYNGHNIGGVVGIIDNSSTISNCHVSGVIRGGHKVGGVVGKLSNSSVASYLSSSGEVKEGLAHDGTENGVVNGSQRNFGGLIGDVYYSDVYFSYSSCEISGRYNQFGGLIGSFNSRNNNKIVSCYAIGNVSATAMPSYNNNNAGGLVGSFDSSYSACSMINCYATGDVIGTGDNVGGLIGVEHTYRGNPIIQNCYATGIVNGGDKVGGIVGSCDSNISNSIAFNPKINGANIGRVFGDGSNTTNNYANSSMTVNDSIVADAVTNPENTSNGKGMTIDDLKNNTSNNPYSYWEFDSDNNGDLAYWKIDDDRPVLYVDPDDDGHFKKLGYDDGIIAIPSDTTAPTVNIYSPIDDATDVTTDSILVLTFDEDVAKGTGNITIKKVSNDYTVETISVTDLAVSISSAEVTIILTNDLDYNTEYYINIDEGAFKDKSDNNYVGIDDKATWKFTTKSEF